MPHTLEDASWENWQEESPPGLDALVAKIAAAWDDEAAGEPFVRQALALAPGHLKALKTAYKFYYVHYRMPEAAEMALASVAYAARRLGLSQHWQATEWRGDDWRRVRPEDADFSNSLPLPRLFLISLRTYGFMLARLRRIDEACAVLSKVVSLDPEDKVKARGLLATVEGGPDEAQAA